MHSSDLSKKNSIKYGKKSKSFTIYNKNRKKFFYNIPVLLVKPGFKKQTNKTKPPKNQTINFILTKLACIMLLAHLA